MSPAGIPLYRLSRSARQGLCLAREGRRRCRVGRDKGAGIFGLHHPRPQAQRERPLPQGGGGHLDHARQPGHARADSGGAQGGRLRDPLGVHARAARQRGDRAVRRSAGRNGDDTTLAKNLARWLEGEGGLTAYSDEPIPPDLLDVDGEPLDMAGLAQADPEFAKTWRKVETRRSVIRSQMVVDGKRPPEERVVAACAEDRHYQRYLAACEERHGRYLKIFDLFKAPATHLPLEDAHQQIITDGLNPYGRRVIA